MKKLKIANGEELLRVAPLSLGKIVSESYYTKVGTWRNIFSLLFDSLSKDVSKIDAIEHTFKSGGFSYNNSFFLQKIDIQLLSTDDQGFYLNKTSEYPADLSTLFNCSPIDLSQVKNIFINSKCLSPRYKLAHGDYAKFNLKRDITKADLCVVPFDILDSLKFDSTSEYRDKFGYSKPNLFSIPDLHKTLENALAILNVYLNQKPQNANDGLFLMKEKVKLKNLSSTELSNVSILISSETEQYYSRGVVVNSLNEIKDVLLALKMFISDPDFTSKFEYINITGNCAAYLTDALRSINILLTPECIKELTSLGFNISDLNINSVKSLTTSIIYPIFNWASIPIDNIDTEEYDKLHVNVNIINISLPEYHLINNCKYKITDVQFNELSGSEIVFEGEDADTVFDTLKSTDESNIELGLNLLANSNFRKNLPLIYYILSKNDFSNIKYSKSVPYKTLYNYYSTMQDEVLEAIDELNKMNLFGSIEKYNVFNINLVELLVMCLLSGDSDLVMFRKLVTKMFNESILTKTSFIDINFTMDISEEKVNMIKDNLAKLLPHHIEIIDPSKKVEEVAKPEEIIDTFA